MRLSCLDLRRGWRARGEARVSVAKLWHPVALDSEAVTDERQFYHLRARRVRGELIQRVRAAHLVLLSLQGDPRLAQIRRRLQQPLVLRVLCVVQSCAGAQCRAAEVLVGAEAQAQRAGERARWRLHQRRVYHGRAGGVADQHRHLVLGEADLFLHLVAEGFEIRCDHLARRRGL